MDNPSNWNIYENKVILTGSSAVAVSTTTSLDNVTINITPTKTGNGKLSIPVNIDSNSGIGYVEYADSLSTHLISGSFTGTSYTISNNSISAGAYTVTFSFYDNSTNKKLLYRCVEVINVFDNLTTTTWCGTAPYLTTVSGSIKFSITKTLVDSFAMTTFCVSNEGDDNNSGTSVKPLATIAAALSKCTASDTQYTIFLLSELTVDGQITITANQDIVLTAKPANPNASTPEGTIIKRGFSAGNSILTIESGATFAMKNIILDGQRTTYSNYPSGGGGIWTAGTVTLTNCTIQNCQATSGGGLFASAGTVDLKNTVIGKSLPSLINNTSAATNETVATSITCCNKATYGGGIFVAGTAVVNMLANSAVGYNYASATPNNPQGGGVFLESGTFCLGSSSDNTPEIYANGALMRGVALGCRGGTAKIYGKIHHNYSANYSGGIEMSGCTLYVYSTALISYNYSNSSFGGGVHMSADNVGNAYISTNAVVNNVGLAQVFNKSASGYLHELTE